MSVLGHSETIEAALSGVTQFHGISTDYLVVFECPLAEAQKLIGWGSPRANMKIVWRGASDLAKQFRVKRRA
jgi:hypothetical protein